MFQKLFKQENVKEYEIWGATSYSGKSDADGKPNVYIGEAENCYGTPLTLVF